MGEGIDLDRGAGVGVDGEHIEIGEREADGVVPVTAELVLPPIGDPAVTVELDDEAGLGATDALLVPVRRRRAAGARRAADGAWTLHGVAGDVAGAGVAHLRFVDAGRLIAGPEDRRVHRAAVGTDGQGARLVAEQRHDGERRAAERRAEIGRVEHPHIGAADAFEIEVAARHRCVLAAVGRGNERAVAARAGEDDVLRLVADEQRADDVRDAAADVDDADAVGEVVDDPHLAAAAHRHRHRLHAHLDRCATAEPARHDVEDLQRIVRRVGGVERRPVGRQRQGPHRPGFEGDERGRLRCRLRRQGHDERDHGPPVEPSPPIGDRAPVLCGVSPFAHRPPGSCVPFGTAKPKREPMLFLHAGGRPHCQRQTAEAPFGGSIPTHSSRF